MSHIITKRFRELTTMQYNRITQAREQVFYLEQHVTCPDADMIDLDSTFMWIEQGDSVVAFLRIIPPGHIYTEASIGRVLVATDHRHQGLCRQMMLEAMRYIGTTWEMQSIRISAQSYLAPFYASLGFDAVSEEYLEAGIPHIKMVCLNQDHK